MLIVSQTQIGKTRISIQFYHDHRPFLLDHTVRVDDPMPWGFGLAESKPVYKVTVSQSLRTVLPTNETK